MHLKIIQPPLPPAVLSSPHQYVALLVSNILLIVYNQLSSISTVQTGSHRSWVGTCQCLYPSEKLEPPSCTNSTLSREGALRATPHSVLVDSFFKVAPVKILCKWPQLPWIHVLSSHVITKGGDHLDEPGSDWRAQHQQQNKCPLWTLTGSMQNGLWHPGP